MAWKVANYNSLQHEAQMLRERYDNLQRKVKQTNEQLASLQLLADEVTTAYGVKKQLAGSPDLVGEAPGGNSLVPTMRETLAEYSYLRTTNLARRQQNIFSRADVNVLPSVWPVNGRLMGGYGVRSDPFSGEGAMHTGVDISAPQGTPCARGGGRNRHACGLERRLWTLCDHRSRQQLPDVVRAPFANGCHRRRGNPQGEVLGAVGTTGRSTGVHLHYEVRIGSTPVNPYRFLARASVVHTAAVSKRFPVLTACRRGSRSVK